MDPISREPGQVAQSSNNFVSDDPITKASNKYSYNNIGMGASEHQLAAFLNNPSVPEERKQALLAQIGGLQSNLPTESWLDRLSSSVIGTSNYQKAINQLGTNIGSLIGQYVNTDYQEQYNSEIEQEQRMRQSGTNPDIQGLDAGNAADFDDQSSFPSSPSSVYPAYGPGSVSSSIMSVISGVFSWASSIQGLIQSGVNLDISRLSEESQELDYVTKYAHSSDLIPSTAAEISPGVRYSIPGTDRTVSFADEKGNLIPYSRLSNDQKLALSALMEDNDLSNIYSSISDIFLQNPRLSSNKKNRLSLRLQSYLKSEQFRRKWYDDKVNAASNRLSLAKTQSDPMFSAVDNLLEGYQKALDKSNYDRITTENIFNSKYYKQLIEQGIPQERAENEARQYLRDEADNWIVDAFRDNLLDTLKDPNSSDWSKLFSRIGLILLYYVKNSNNGKISIK